MELECENCAVEGEVNKALPVGANFGDAFHAGDDAEALELHEPFLAAVASDATEEHERHRVHSLGRCARFMTGGGVEQAAITAATRGVCTRRLIIAEVADVAVVDVEDVLPRRL